MCSVFPLLALLAASPGGRLAVVEVEGPDMMLGLAGQVTRAVIAEASSQKLAFAGPDELKASLAPKRYEALRRCGGQAACVAQALEGTGFTRAVLGQLGRDEKNYLLKLWLIDVTTLSVVADVDRAVLIAARRFNKDLEEAVPRLLRGEREARGTLVVDSNLPDAQISVNGDFVGAPPVSLPLKPGKYEVHLERKKYLPVTRLLEVEAGKETREKIALLLKPGEVADEPLGALAQRAGSNAPGGGLRVTAPTWVALGVTVVAAGATLYFGLTEQAQERKLLGGFNAATGSYAGTRQDALATQQSALFANISLAVAGAGLVTTVVLLIRDAVSPQAVAVAPLVSPGVAGLALGGHF